MATDTTTRATIERSAETRMADDVDSILAELKRHRDDLNRQIRDLEDSRPNTAELLEKLRNWRERRKERISR
jgi:hypothetical protein